MRTGAARIGAIQGGLVMDWARRLRVIRGALRLDRREIVRAIDLGGGSATGSMVHAWLSAPGTQKEGVRGQMLNLHRNAEPKP